MAVWRGPAGVLLRAVPIRLAHAPDDDGAAIVAVLATTVWLCGGGVSGLLAITQ